MKDTIKDSVRVAIIDHDHHILHIEDIPNSKIEEYGGEEEYIKDNFMLGDNWSWDYIVYATYYSEENEDGVDIDFSKL